MAIVVALLSALAIFGASLVVVSTTHQVGGALDLQGARAYHAARGALEWGLYHVLRPGFGGCAGIDNRSIDYPANLAGFRATVTCQASTHPEGAGTVTMFRITATACNDTDCVTVTARPLGYVNRQVRAVIAGS